MRLGRHRGGEEHRVDRDAIAFGRLTQADASAEQAIFAKGRVGSGRRAAHRASSPAGGNAQARARVTIHPCKRRGIASMLPSTRLV